MGGDKIAQGYCVAAFSLGRVVSSPWLGKWSTVAGYRTVLIFSSCIIMIGTITYAFASNLETLFAAQVIMGLGSGTLGVTRAYVADKSPHDQRTYWLAYLTAVQVRNGNGQRGRRARLLIRVEGTGVSGALLHPRRGVGYSKKQSKKLGEVYLALFPTAVSSEERSLFCNYAKSANGSSSARYPISRVLSAVSQCLPPPALVTMSHAIPAPFSAPYTASSSLLSPHSFHIFSPPPQYAGFTCMPIVGAILSECLGNSNYSATVLGVSWQLNQFTAPAYVMCLAALFCAVLLSTAFKDALPPRKKKSSPSQVSSRTEVAGLIDRSMSQRRAELQAMKELSRSLSREEGGTAVAAEAGGVPVDGNGNGKGGVMAEPPNPSKQKVCMNFTMFDLAICGGFLLNIATKGTIACFETLGAEYSIVHFHMTSAEAGATFATFGAFGVASLLSMRLLCLWLSDVQLVLGGVLVMIFGCCMLISSPTGVEGLLQFLIAVASMYSVGYPIGHTAVLGLFSKVVGKRPQGTLLGWFGSAGSLARICFPILAGVVSEEFGSAHLFALLVGVLIVAFVGLFASRRTYYYYIDSGGDH
ncbi:unnamed protein product [Phaeothamnion confervicola]